MRYLRWLLLFLTSGLAGCGQGPSGVQLKTRAILDFNSGRVEIALAEAKRLKGHAPADSDYLEGQFMVFTAMAHGGAFSLLKPYYRGMADLNPDSASELGRDRFLVAKVFASIYLDGRAEADDQLTKGCMRLGYGPVHDCIGRLGGDALGSYLNSRSNLDRVHLAEVSLISSILEVGDSQLADYGFAMSLIGVDDRRSTSIIRHLLQSGWINERRSADYCEISGSSAKPGIGLCERQSGAPSKGELIGS